MPQLCSSSFSPWLTLPITLARSCRCSQPPPKPLPASVLGQPLCHGPTLGTCLVSSPKIYGRFRPSQTSTHHAKTLGYFLTNLTFSRNLSLIWPQLETISSSDPSIRRHHDWRRSPSPRRRCFLAPKCLAGVPENLTWQVRRHTPWRRPAGMRSSVNLGRRRPLWRRT
jgi:hypothetical protein